MTPPSSNPHTPDTGNTPGGSQVGPQVGPNTPSGQHASRVGPRSPSLRGDPPREPANQVGPNPVGPVGPDAGSDRSRVGSRGGAVEALAAVRAYLAHLDDLGPYWEPGERPADDDGLGYSVDGFGAYELRQGHLAVLVAALEERESYDVLVDACHAEQRAVWDAGRGQEAMTLEQHWSAMAGWRDEQRRAGGRAVSGLTDAERDVLHATPVTEDAVVEIVRGRVERLERWKAEALPVIAGLQEVGRALGLRLGEQITGRAAVDAALDLRNERDALATRLGAVEALAERTDRETSVIDHLVALERAATPGPWQHFDANEGTGHFPGWMVANDAFHNPPADEDAPWLAVELHTGVEADAALIAAVRNALPALLTIARAQLDRGQEAPDGA
jgi:hypothetical protein